MAATADKVEYSQLRSEIIDHGSSWAAMSWCLASRPVNLAELLRDVGVGDLPARRRRTAFNACADGYAVFDDGRTRCKV